MTTGAEFERAHFFAQYSLAFDLLVQWSVEDGRTWDAVRFAESGRNRTFLDQVRAAGVDFCDTLKEDDRKSLLDRRTKLMEDYVRRREEIRTAFEEGKPDRADEFTRELGELQNAISEVEREIRDKSPVYRSLLKDSQRFAPTEQEFRLVGEPSDMVLMYYCGCTGSHVFLISGGECSACEAFSLEVDAETAGLLGIRRGPLTRKTIARLVNRYVARLREEKDLDRDKRGVGPAIDVSEGGDMTERAQVRLTDLLMPPPIRRRVQQYRRVIVIPDGALHQLPFESLLVSDDGERRQYILDCLPPIAYAPSAMIMVTLKERSAAGGPSRSLLSVADPAYAENHPAADDSSDAPVRAAYGEFGGQLSPLPATREECRSVVAACREAELDVEELLGQAATEKNVRDRLRGKTIVHLAAHGMVDQEHDNCFGAVALAPPPGGVSSLEDDGFLSLHEIHNLPLQDCDLAVLSACNTNVGPDRPLEVGSTMARAFFAAGVSRVVCSHWSVNDDSTSLLMSEFFKNLSRAWKNGESVDYASALQLARKQVRGQEKYRDPYYWAPFVLIGPPDEPTNRRP